MFSEKKIAVLRVRALIIDAARCWLNQNGYVEVQGPIILPAIGDQPASFEVKYFDKKGYLTQGLQPYAHSFVSNLGKVFTIAPAFRSEKMRTRRHLTEYWRIQVAQQCRFDDIIKVQEKLITHVCQILSANAADALHLLNISTDALRVKTPFPILTYDAAIELLQRDGFGVWWGQNFDWGMENHISLSFGQPFFITRFPVNAETYFHRSDPEKPELSLSADVLAPQGYGEIGSSGEIITEKEALSQKMIEENIDVAGQRWYLRHMECNSSPQSGFALGLERLIQWICRLADVKEAVAFPRVYDSDLL